MHLWRYVTTRFPANLERNSLKKAMHFYCDVASLCKFGALKSYLFLVLSRVPLRRWSMAMCRRNLFHYALRVCTELQVLSKTASRLWFYANKKYKNGNSARRTVLQRHIRSSITLNGSDNFRISGKLPKKQLQTSFSRERLIVSPQSFAWQFRRSSPMTYFIIVAL